MEDNSPRQPPKNCLPSNCKFSHMATPSTRKAEKLSGKGECNSHEATQDLATLAGLCPQWNISLLCH